MARSEGVGSLLGVILFLPLHLLVGEAGSHAAEVPPDLAAARLEVQALPDCATREALVARVAARSSRIHWAADPAGPNLRAAIARAPHNGAVAELVIVQPDGTISSRRLSAPSCEEATDAIALVIALTLDPMSAPGDHPAAPPPSPLPDSDVTAAAPSHSSPPPPPPPLPPAPTRPRFGVGAAAQAIFGPAPGVLPSIAVYAFAQLGRDAFWSPALFLLGTHAWRNDLVEPGGTAAFTLDAASLDACALRLRVSVVEARACAGGLVGRLAASGSDTYSPTSSVRPFAAVGGSLLSTVGIGSVLEASARVGVGASLVRDAFAFAPFVFYRTAAVVVTPSLGLGVRLP
jgi:hypothetical protein